VRRGFILTCRRRKCVRATAELFEIPLSDRAEVQHDPTSSKEITIRAN
jgi:hypothetical protein